MNPLAQTPEVSAPPVQWDQQDATALRAYVFNNPRFLAALWQKRGEIDIDRPATAAEIAGFERCFKTLKSLCLDLPQSDLNVPVDITED